MNLGRFFIEIHGKFRNGKTLLCGESKFVDENRMKFVMKCSKLSNNRKDDRTTPNKMVADQKKECYTKYYRERSCV